MNDCDSRNVEDVYARAAREARQVDYLYERDRSKDLAREVLNLRARIMVLENRIRREKNEEK